MLDTDSGLQSSLLLPQDGNPCRQVDRRPQHQPRQMLSVRALQGPNRLQPPLRPPPATFASSRVSSIHPDQQGYRLLLPPCQQRRKRHMSLEPHAHGCLYPLGGVGADDHLPCPSQSTRLAPERLLSLEALSGPPASDNTLDPQSSQLHLLPALLPPHLGKGRPTNVPAEHGLDQESSLPPEQLRPHPLQPLPRRVHLVVGNESACRSLALFPPEPGDGPLPGGGVGEVPCL
mmetsp:Transcript_26548/g.60564  ORF Transcript_26548/g.60564 Transcript_26548/m.60564 type:complete len:232 (-) Transcript_26548:1607-2302(-)